MRTNTYTSKKDGTVMDFAILIPDNPICILVIWPCSLCSCSMYKIPSEKFAGSGIGTIQFNPRAHGKSEGRFSYEDSFSDLKDLCEEIIKPGVPLTCLGHSGGAGALLKTGEKIGAERIWLVSPVLDSRESLFFMYDNQRIEEFTGLITSFAKDPQSIKRILETSRWLDPETWSDEKLKSLLNELSGEIEIGSLLEAIFIPGYNAFEEFRLLSDRLEIIYPLHDSWYPEKTVMALAKESDVPVVRDLGGKDHYFTGAWKNIWNYIEKRLISLYSQDQP